MTPEDEVQRALALSDSALPKEGNSHPEDFHQDPVHRSGPGEHPLEAPQHLVYEIRGGEIGNEQRDPPAFGRLHHRSGKGERGSRDGARHRPGEKEIGDPGLPVGGLVPEIGYLGLPQDLDLSRVYRVDLSRDSESGLLHSSVGDLAGQAGRPRRQPQAEGIGTGLEETAYRNRHVMRLLCRSGLFRNRRPPRGGSFAVRRRLPPRGETAETARP